jgi:hypothetical protein
MRLSGSTSEMWKRSMAWIVRHRQTKEPETDRPSLNHRATSRLYPCVYRSILSVEVPVKLSETSSNAPDGQVKLPKSLLPGRYANHLSEMPTKRPSANLRIADDPGVGLFKNESARRPH